MSEPRHDRRRAQRAGSAARRGAALSLAAMLGGAILAPAHAASDPGDRQSQLRRRIHAAEGALEDLSADAKRAVLALRATQAAIPVAQRARQAAQARLAAAQWRKVDLDAALEIAQAEERAGLEALRRNAEQTQDAQDRRNDMARQAYQGGGQERLALLLAGGTAQELSERLYLFEKATDAQNAALDDLAQMRRQAQEDLIRLAAARRKVADLNQQAKANLAEAENAKAAAVAAEQELARLANTQRGQVADLNSRRAAEEKRLQALQAESDKVAALLRAQAAAEAARQAKRAKKGTSGRSTSGGGFDPAPPAPGGRLSYPVNAPVTSEFGMRYHPILKYWRLHAGADFGAACGTPVHASADGVVVRAGWAGGYGNQVLVAHSGGLATSYNHLSAILTRSGRVGRGQLIGRVGTTGLSTGCHLHFEVRLGGSPVNPRRYL